MLNIIKWNLFKGEKNLNKSINNWFVPVAAVLIAAVALAGCSAPASNPTATSDVMLPWLEEEFAVTFKVELAP